MRILQLAARMLSLERFALPLMRVLRDSGFTVEAMAGFDGTEQRLHEDRFTTHHWKAGHSLNPMRMIAARRHLRDFMRRERFDIVHSHCSFGGIIANPVVARFDPHLIYTQHGFYVHEGLNPLMRRAWLRVEQTGLRPADHVICVSEQEHRIASSLSLGPAEKFIHVPGAGVEVARFHLSEQQRLMRRERLREELAIAPDRPVLLTVSRLTWDKGYREMIEAARSLRQRGHDLVLIAAGSGKDEAGIRRAIERAGIAESFRLLGWRDDVADLYCAADIFIFSSYREGLPIAPIEAMASGLPVVLSDIPGCREEVEHEESGLLFPTGDAQALAAALAKLLEEPRRRQALGEAARERARIFDLERVLELQLALYREIAASR